MTWILFKQKFGLIILWARFYLLPFLYKLENKLPRQANIGAVCSF